MKAKLRIPARYVSIYEQAKEEAHQRHLAVVDTRTAMLAEVDQRRRQRDRMMKIERTMHIARMRTAERRQAVAA